MRLDQLIADLAAEHRDLDAVVTGLADADWTRPTRAAGWDVRDSLSHLCYFDEAATLAVTDPAAFDVHRRAQRRQRAAGAVPDVDLGRGLAEPQLLLERWRAARAGLLDAIGRADPVGRVPWYALPMSLASLTTARLMETWAHGVDIREALALPPAQSDRLRHVCDLGYRARPYAFAAHGVEDPGTPVRLVVRAPGGGEWTWGPAESADRITGSALDVALVLTQRRHPDRTGVTASGPVAALWLPIAQAFAGAGTVAARDR